eukprot:998273-Lingulodinium_polyedra.AAC.1
MASWMSSRTWDACSRSSASSWTHWRWRHRRGLAAPPARPAAAMAEPRSWWALRPSCNRLA